MSEAVIDHLQIIKVHHDISTCSISASMMVQKFPNPSPESSSVIQVGQEVMISFILQIFLLFQKTVGKIFQRLRHLINLQDSRFL